MTALRKAKRWLYLIHRWMGIVGCLFFAIWFASGMVMMYVAFPDLTREERLNGLPSIVWGQVQVMPEAALEQSGLSIYPARFVLEMMGDEPVYRINAYSGESISLSARDGHLIKQVDAQQAVRIASAFAGGKSAHLQETLERDQWTVPQNLDPLRPLHRIAIDDGQGSELYVSARNGAVIRDTHRNERFWNWLGSVPHWIYFTPLRADQPLWRQVNIWLSGIVMIVPVTGLFVGILRLRWRRPYVNGHYTPYHGWQKWHHLAGLIGGVFLLTWIISGWLSVNPNRWFAERSIGPDERIAYAGQAAARFSEQLPVTIKQPGIKEVRFVWIDGQPLIQLTAAKPTSNPSAMLETMIDPQTGNTVRFDPQRLFEASRRLVPSGPLLQRRVLTQEDAYWYSHHTAKTLPVLRAEFGDEHHTWVHIDPASGAVLGQRDDSDRKQRWFFNALHQLDYLWLVQSRPVWDAIVIALLSCGLIISCSGVVIGIRRLRRQVVQG